MNLCVVELDKKTETQALTRHLGFWYIILQEKVHESVERGKARDETRLHHVILSN